MELPFVILPFTAQFKQVAVKTKGKNAETNKKSGERELQIFTSSLKESRPCKNKQSLNFIYRYEVGLSDRQPFVLKNILNHLNGDLAKIK